MANNRPSREGLLFQWPILAIERVSTLLMANTGHQEDGECALANIGNWEIVDVLDGQYWLLGESRIPQWPILAMVQVLTPSMTNIGLQGSVDFDP